MSELPPPLPHREPSTPQPMLGPVRAESRTVRDSPQLWLRLVLGSIAIHGAIASLIVSVDWRAAERNASGNVSRTEAIPIELWAGAPQSETNSPTPVNVPTSSAPAAIPPPDRAPEPQAIASIPDAAIEPIAVPEPIPTPLASPEPAPIARPSPVPTPTPVLNPTPSPTPSPTPNPSPTTVPTPESSPTPTTAETPSPDMPESPEEPESPNGDTSDDRSETDSQDSEESLGEGNGSDREISIGEVQRGAIVRVAPLPNAIDNPNQIPARLTDPPANIDIAISPDLALLPKDIAIPFAIALRIELSIATNGRPQLVRVFEGESTIERRDFEPLIASLLEAWQFDAATSVENGLEVDAIELAVFLQWL